MTPRLFALFCALITIFVWASSFPAITLGLRSFDPLPLAALRFLIASTILLGLVIARAGTPNLLFFMAPAAAVISIPVVGIWPGPETVAGGLIALVGVLIVHRSKLTVEQRRGAPN